MTGNALWQADPTVGGWCPTRASPLYNSQPPHGRLHPLLPARPLSLAVSCFVAELGCTKHASPRPGSAGEPSAQQTANLSSSVTEKRKGEQIWFRGKRRSRRQACSSVSCSFGGKSVNPRTPSPPPRHPASCPELIRACDPWPRDGDTHLQPSAVAEQTPLQQGLALPEQRVPAASSPLAPRGIRGAGGGGACVQYRKWLTLQRGAARRGPGRVRGALSCLETKRGRETSRVLAGPIRAGGSGPRVLGLPGRRAALRFSTFPRRTEREPDEAEAGGEGRGRAGGGRGDLGATRLLWGRPAFCPGAPCSFPAGGILARTWGLRTVHGWALPPDTQRPQGRTTWAARRAIRCQLRTEPQRSLGSLSPGSALGLGGPQGRESRLLCWWEVGSQPRGLASGLQGQGHAVWPWTQTDGAPRHTPRPGPGTRRPGQQRGT